MSHGAVIIAAGYGSLRGDNGKGPSKLLETIGGNTLITRVVSTAMHGNLEPCVVVVNPVYGPAIQRELEYQFSGWEDLHFVLQPASYGTGDAAGIGAHKLDELRVKHCTVLYADMPLVRSATINELRRQHETQGKVMTMATYERTGGDDGMENFARVLREKSTGEIIDVVEVRQNRNPTMTCLKLVNPALMAFRLEWMLANLPKLVPHEMGNDYPAETNLPDLVALAAKDGGVSELRLDRSDELAGVNTLEQLERAQKLYEARHDR